MVASRRYERGPPMSDPGREVDVPRHQGILESLPGLLDTASTQLPGVARIAAGAWWRSAVWTAGASGRSGRLLLRVATNPQSSGELIEEVARDVSVAARKVSEVARRISTGTPVAQALVEGGASLVGTPAAQSVLTAEVEPTRPGVDLRERGARLLERSRDVMDSDEVHPAFVSILDNLAPDEARILRMLLEHGPQASVDVRTGGPVGMVSSQLIASGLNMIGPRAGVRYVDRVPSYLNNLFRLGLIWLSRETLDDPTEYQVVEAQPDVLAAMRTVRFTKIIRRSIHLTPFGEDFCRTCLLDEDHAGTEFPDHAAPPEADADENL